MDMFRLCESKICCVDRLACSRARDMASVVSEAKDQSAERSDRRTVETKQEPTKKSQQNQKQWLRANQGKKPNNLNSKDNDVSSKKIN